MQRPSALTVLHSSTHRLGRPGIGTIAWHQIEGTSEEGCNVVAACTSFGKKPQYAVRNVATLEIFGFPVPKSITGVDRACKLHDLRVARLLERMGGRIDIIHCWPIGALETLRTAKKLGIKSVLERPNAHAAYAYEVAAEEHKKLGLAMPKKYSHAYNHHRLEREEAEYALADRLLIPSEFVRKTFLERGFDAAQLVRHQYGYDPTRFRSVPENLQERSQRPFTVAFVGRGEPRKGLHYALRAWSASGLGRQGRFVICGEIMRAYSEILAQWLSHPSVEILGFVPDVAAVMRQSDVLVLPSLEEGSALVTHEARASGCVLVVSDRSGAHCEHLKDGLIHPAGDVHTIREHLLLLNQDRNLLCQLRECSIRGIRELTWQHAGKVLTNIYRETVALR